MVWYFFQAKNMQNSPVLFLNSMGLGIKLCCCIYEVSLRSLRNHVVWNQTHGYKLGWTPPTSTSCPALEYFPDLISLCSIFLYKEELKTPIVRVGF
jgi:hypothetical protein